MTKQQLQGERLCLRALKKEAAQELLEILSNEEVVKFLPMLPLISLKDAEAYIDQELHSNLQGTQLSYGIYHVMDERLIGCIHVGLKDAHDFGYVLHQKYWHHGYASEAGTLLLEHLRKHNLVPFVTATHDVNNPRSGLVMQRLGMHYCYSYEELWQPKNYMVTFRMYQYTFDDNMGIYQGYCKRYPYKVETLS